LAEAQVGIDPGSAVDHLLHIVKAAPAWREGAGRATLLKVLDALGPSHPIAISGRKALAKALFR
jgi:putative thioredoxin